MLTSEIISYLLTWGIIGCVLFSIFVVFAFRSGLVYTAREDDGLLKKRIPLIGVFAMSIIPLSLLGLHLISNYVNLVCKNITLNFLPLYLLNYGLFSILFIYDSLVIDGYVISVWRPPILNIPDAMGIETMKKHILVSIPLGLFLGAVLTFIATSLSYFAWMK